MITPSFNLTATERVLPRLALDFTTALLDNRVTITRALNTATAVNSSGFVAGINANLPRFDYDPVAKTCRGLLIEELRANVCIQSGDIDNVAWSRAGVGVVGDTVTSPAGTTTGNTVTCSAGSSVHRVVSTAGTVTNGAAVTHSVFLKAGTHSFCQIHDGSTGTFYANFNLSTGAVTAVNPANGAAITSFGNGWYRCTLTITAGTTTSIGAICVIPDGTSVRNPTWTAIGTESVYAWGYQVEVGAFATSYIPTTTTSLTRNADDVSMTGTNFTSWYNQSAGTLVARFAPAVANFGANRYPVAISAGASTNAFAIRMSSGAFLGYCLTAGVNQYFNSAGTASAGVYAICGLSLDSTGGVFSANGTLSTAVNTATLPTVDRLALGNFTGGAQGAYHIAKIWYYPQRLINPETQAFTK